ncbi:signal peptidase II [Streptomyces sp. Li-HN-5-11]|uniref:signal peptidase II n=1 Tax=Streptomyces sp. Li-HN-5-11 TaxID=3075432 RepID=UPI0028A65F3B|nr:signal peptidase II [Streptomyces sp. Li-HN-5-11]WNM32893.1 signal peptidase II [Streptomyces sp. Li-HN-5-11]
MGADAGAARRRVWVLWTVAGIAYAIDQASKAAVVATLEGHAPVPVIGTWMELQVQRNPGAAFGLGQATTIVFTLIAAVVAVAIVRVSRRLTSTPWAITLGLLLGGALGNLTDRVFRSPGRMQGAVVDFIAVRDFSVMNLADWAITCGSALALVLSFRGQQLTAPNSSSDGAGDSGPAQQGGAGVS